MSASHIYIDPAITIDLLGLGCNDAVRGALPPEPGQISSDVVESSAIEVGVGFACPKTCNRNDGAVVAREMMRSIKLMNVHLAIIQRRFRWLPVRSLYGRPDRT